MATDPPTYYRDIKPLFSQWDRIQMIGRFDLWSYADVKSRANSIWLSLQEDPTKPNTGWSLLPFVHVMPEVNGPLPQADIDLFKAWIDAGCIEGDHPAPPVKNPLLPVFIALSEALTGFDDLHANPDLAQAYLDRLLAGDAKAAVNGLLAAQAGIDAVPYAQRAARLGPDAGKDAGAQAIILIWYNGGVLPTANASWYSMAPAPQKYIYGLVWRAISAHPMGYASENTPSYWRFQPQPTQSPPMTGASGPAAGWPT
jgi:hypothetical protein